MPGITGSQATSALATTATGRPVACQFQRRPIGVSSEPRPARTATPVKTVTPICRVGDSEQSGIRPTGPSDSSRTGRVSCSLTSYPRRRDGEIMATGKTMTDGRATTWRVGKRW